MAQQPPPAAMPDSREHNECPGPATFSAGIIAGVLHHDCATATLLATFGAAKLRLLQVAVAFELRPQLAARHRVITRSSCIGSCALVALSAIGVALMRP